MSDEVHWSELVHGENCQCCTGSPPRMDDPTEDSDEPVNDD